MPVTARLYDAEGLDREVRLERQVVKDLGEKQLLWIDITGFEEKEVENVGKLMGLPEQAVRSLLQPIRRPRLDNYGEFAHININCIQEDKQRYKVAELDFVVDKNFIITVHSEPIDFLKSFDRQTKGDTQLGHLDASAFLMALLDWHITSFFRIIERLDLEVDRLDELALEPHRDHDLFNDLILLRRRVGQVRMALTPHREVYAALTRPDFVPLTGEDSAHHFAILNERLERAIESVENARELLVGSFEIFTTQATLRTNSIMKTLTLVSVTLLPATLLTGITGMLIKTPVYNIGDEGFWAMLVIMAVIGGLTLMFARRKRWI